MAVSRNKNIIIGVGVLLVIGTIVAATVWGRRTDLPEVQVAKVEKRALLESKVTANGEVRPIQFINLTAEVAGRVTDPAGCAGEGRCEKAFGLIGVVQADDLWPARIARDGELLRPNQANRCRRWWGWRRGRWRGWRGNGRAIGHGHHERIGRGTTGGIGH